MSQNKSIITFLALALYGVFFALAAFDGILQYYIFEIFFFAAVTLFLHASFRFWRLNTPVYALFPLSFALHLMGIFGWYDHSPLFLPWDHVTHLVPLFTITVFFFNFLRPHMGERFWSAKTWAMLCVVLFVGMGVGAAVENVEFVGFLSLGFGQGGLFMGGAGDGLPLDQSMSDAIQEIGGGYLNTEYDLVWNLFGTIAALVVMCCVQFATKRAPSRIG
jgi:hypothetical protein